MLSCIIESRSFLHWNEVDCEVGCTPKTKWTTRSAIYVHSVFTEIPQDSWRHHLFKLTGARCADTGGANVSDAGRGGSLHKVSPPVYSLSSSLPPQSFGGSVQISRTLPVDHTASVTLITRFMVLSLRWRLFQATLFDNSTIKLEILAPFGPLWQHSGHAPVLNLIMWPPPVREPPAEKQSEWEGGRGGGEEFETGSFH